MSSSPMALSLDVAHDSILSSHSDGSIALHRLQDTGELRLLSRWRAHTLLGQPVEAWTAVLMDPEGRGEEVWSGGDDAALKGWDLRVGTRTPVWVDRTTHTAGVTCIARERGREGARVGGERKAVTGSYDGVLRLWDVRALGVRPICESECDEAGGGLWRIKWHPGEGGIMAVAAMHGGACVLKYEEGRGWKKKAGYDGHASMVYGIDWWRGGRHMETAGTGVLISASFYDRALHLWQYGA